MQPKPIDSRHLLDIDAQKRLVDMEGIVQHLRSVRDHKEHPAETDYDIVHDEAGRRNREETAEEFARRMKKAREERAKKTPPRESGAEETPADSDSSDTQKGSHLDIEA